MNIKRLIGHRSYRGGRHRKNLRARPAHDNQRAHQKGPRRAIGGARRSPCLKKLEAHADANQTRSRKQSGPKPDAKPAPARAAGAPREQEDRRGRGHSRTSPRRSTTRSSPICDMQGNAIPWGASGKAASRDREVHAFAATVAASRRRVSVEPRREARARAACRVPARPESAIQALASAGLQIRSIRDVTSIPHNGCRPPKNGGSSMSRYTGPFADCAAPKAPSCFLKARAVDGEVRGRASRYAPGQHGQSPTAPAGVGVRATLDRATSPVRQRVPLKKQLGAFAPAQSATGPVYRDMLDRRFLGRPHRCAESASRRGSNGLESGACQRLNG